MSIAALGATDPIAQTVHWIAARGVAVEPWPPVEPPIARPPLSYPVLRLVEPSAEPPPFDHELADWVRLPADAGDLVARADLLLARARRVGAVLAHVDADDVLRVGDQVAILTPLEGRIMRILLADVGQLVPRERIERALWPNGLADDGALYNRVRRLRQHLRHLPVEIHTVRGRGLLLDVEPPPLPPAA